MHLEQEMAILFPLNNVYSDQNLKSIEAKKTSEPKFSSRHRSHNVI